MSQTGPLKLGAIHPLTGRQWELEKNEAWPDLEIVLPFSRRVIDTTGTVMGPAVSAEKIGGYDVVHSLDKVELYDLVNSKVVPNVKGVWAASPGGDTARIHLLAQDPFSWLTPHVDTISATFGTPPRTVEQSFDNGPAETFTEERRFGEMLVKPDTKAELLIVFEPYLPTRVMKSEKFTLSFRTLDGASIYIDQLSLLILGRDVQETRRFLVSGAPTTVTSTFVKTVCGDLSLFIADVPLAAPLDSIEIESLKGVALCVYAVRYREARKHVTKWNKKIILVPGRYRITVEGTSKATSYTEPKLPPSKTVKWHLKQEFGVKYPETLRPYIAYCTIGDNRIFSTTPPPPPPSPLAWNPTMLGVGFPSYKKYLALVRFLVPYMSDIYSTIKMQLIYEKAALTLTGDLTPQANPDSASSLPSQSQDWIIAAGGSIMLDEEIIFTKEFPQEGPAKVVLSFTLPDGTPTKLDEWSCYVSHFDSFSQHLNWPSNCLQTYYDSTGKHVVPSCPTLIPVMLHPMKLRGNRMDTLPGRTTLKTATQPKIAVAISTPYVPSEEPQPYPEELNSAPIDWRLPSTMVNQLKPYDQHTGLCYARFAYETGARFNEGYGDKLDGIQDTVDTTTVEGVVDAQGRPFALWVRTPEPVDWRRVTATLKIKHVNQTGSCPSGYAHRRQMDLTVEILPSPDASSAFLIGCFAGIPTRLPRGEYTLVLSFNPYEPGLEKLRPGTGIGMAPEQVQMTFIQPFGQDWPLPLTGVIVPAWILEKLFQAYRPPGPPGPVPSELLRIYEDYLRFGKLIDISQYNVLEIPSGAQPGEVGLARESPQKMSISRLAQPKPSTSGLRTPTKSLLERRKRALGLRKPGMPKRAPKLETKKEKQRGRMR